MADILTQWAAAQAQALMDAGVDGFDAEATMARVVAQVPDGADLTTWVPVPLPAVVADAALDDARAAYYLAAPARMGRLLDAAMVMPHG